MCALRGGGETPPRRPHFRAKCYLREPLPRVLRSQASDDRGPRLGFAEQCVAPADRTEHWLHLPKGWGDGEWDAAGDGDSRRGARHSEEARAWPSGSPQLVVTVRWTPAPASQPGSTTAARAASSSPTSRGTEHAQRRPWLGSFKSKFHLSGS